MGLSFADHSDGKDVGDDQELKLLHRMECKVCPLRTEPGRMLPTGNPKAQIYVIGESPGESEIKTGTQFIGASGQVLRANFDKRFLPLIRWNNCVRSRPPRNRTPERIELECCRPSIIRDVEQTKPQMILGFGGVPLHWVSNFTGITMWRGRRMPVKVGSHTCWYYPMLHPSYFLRLRRTDRDGEVINSEEERMFRFDLDRAFADFEAGLPVPAVHDEKRARAGVEAIVEGGEAGVRAIVEALSWASRQPAAGVDYETNALRPYSKKARILSAGVGTLERSFAFPIDHPRAQFNEEQRLRIADAWRDFLRSKVRKYVHNLTFEMEWTAFFFGVDLLRGSQWEDTAVQASIIDQRKGSFSLEFLVQQHFGFNIKQLSNVNRKDMEKEPIPKLLSYNAIDSKYHLLLGEKQEDIIRQEGLEQVYELSLRRVPTVVLSQLIGIPVDQKVVATLGTKYEQRIAKIEKEIEAVPVVIQFKQQRGRPYNPGSHPDNIEVFHKLLKRRECVITDKYSKKQKLSASEEVLEQIDHPLSKLLIDLRKAIKQKSTYIDPLSDKNEKSVLHPDGLLHCNYNTFFTDTGRLSSSEPNVQNYPKREDEAKEVRKAIAAALKDTILSFDYGQIEARVIAMFTKDKLFCKALWERYDVHMEWAQRIAKAYPQRVGGSKMLTDKKAMKDFRTDIKNEWTFPLFFGAKLESAAGYLNIPVEKIRPLYKEFWRQFAGVKTWQDEQLEFYKKYGYVECLTGRRRHGPLSVNMVYNSPVQGTAAEIVMDAMCRLSETGDPELQPEINVHDDLTFLRVEKRRAEEIAEKILNVLLAVPFSWVNVPITVELNHGPNWMELEEVGAFSSDTWFK